MNRGIIMSGPVGSSTWFGTPGYDLDQSLRFNDGRHLV